MRWRSALRRKLVDGRKDPDGGRVMLEPSDIMFHPPWDSGEYST